MSPVVVALSLAFPASDGRRGDGGGPSTTAAGPAPTQSLVSGPEVAGSRAFFPEPPSAKVVGNPEPGGQDTCERCGGTGWIAVEDPVLGGLIDTRCPDCRPR